MALSYGLHFVAHILAYWWHSGGLNIHTGTMWGMKPFLVSTDTLQTTSAFAQLCKQRAFALWDHRFIYITKTKETMVTWTVTKLLKAEHSMHGAFFLLACTASPSVEKGHNWAGFPTDLTSAPSHLNPLTTNGLLSRSQAALNHKSIGRKLTLLDLNRGKVSLQKQCRPTVVYTHIWYTVSVLGTRKIHILWGPVLLIFLWVRLPRWAHYPWAWIPNFSSLEDVDAN